MFSKDELEDWLTKVGQKVTKPIEIYMIGGCALSFKGLKPTTKDIDIIVKSREDFDILDKAIKTAGFELTTDFDNEFYLTALAVYKKGNSRIDVFLKEVGKRLKLTKPMISHAKKYKSYDKLDVFLLSNEDIFLFKCMTDRPGDVTDCARLTIEELDYGRISNEVQEQSKTGHKHFFELFENLCRIEIETGTAVAKLKPIVYGLVKENWSEKPDDFMEGIDNVELHIADKKLLKVLKTERFIYKPAL